MESKRMSRLGRAIAMLYCLISGVQSEIIWPGEIQAFCGFAPNMCRQYCLRVDPYSINFCEDPRFKPLDEFVNSANGDFFYTNEWSVESQSGYLHVGQLANLAAVPLNGTDLTTPLWRFYAAPHHYYTTDSKDAVAPLTLEQSAGNVYVSRHEGTFQLQRFKKGTLSRLALSYDRPELEARGWVFEKALGWAPRPCSNTLLDSPIKENQWYQINLKNTGLLTWSYDKLTGDGNELQIVWGTPSLEYQPGQKFYTGSHWKITGSEKPGYYVLMNRSMPNASITWEGSAPSGKWVVALDGHAEDPDYLPGGKYRDDCLWKFELVDDGTGKYYSIQNARFPGNGILTWSSDVVPDSDGKRYVEIMTGPDPSKYKLDKDYLWSLTSVGRITGP